ncbi:MAG: UDP-N-acetylmuramoyl-L-alanine--D-glutamate ligase [Blastocatellia bacterium]|nr:UDP-N-acetylmuramoyl-L-alanine--D-glutamate ligase [Blastocatellia bacterium]
MEVTGKKITIIGMAKSGLAAAEFLSARGAQVLVSDSKPAEKLQQESALLRQMGVTLETGKNSDDALMNADLIVVSPGVPLDIAPLARAKAAGKKILGEVELAAKFLKGTLIGITGSNGKTTTTTLVGKILAESGLYTQVGGNIGIPLISLAADSRSDGFVTIEISSFQLEATEDLKLKVAVLLNITPNHLDRYRSFEDYAEAKRRIFLNQQDSDFAVLNADSEIVSQMASSTPAKKIFFSRLKELPEGVFLQNGKIVYRNNNGKEVPLIDVSKIPLQGSHNIENVMAAVAVALVAGVAIESMQRSVAQFRPVAHRLEPVAEIKGVKFINDSKATSVDAAVKAIEAFSGNLILILGGKDKGGSYTPLIPPIRERVKGVVLIGAASDKIEATLNGVVNLHRSTSMKDAVKKSFEAASSGDTVLLAPACSSYDMFENFEQRGDIFKQEVEALSREMVSIT